MIKEASSGKEPFIQTSNAVYFESVDVLGEKTLIQSPKSSNPTLDELLALKNDFEITRHLACEGVLRSRELIKRPTGIAIVKDFFDGITLTKYLDENKLSIESFLEIAIQLAKIVGQLHANKIIHKDINPENILISRDGKILSICNSGIASQLAQEQQELRLNESLKGSLSHISPEQTGRMNRSIDYRSDLYSLGVTLYQALCGNLPFTYTDAIELVHAHIARYPVEPSKIDPNISESLSAIVMKLMAKNAEDRYQSASGLQVDLEECLKQWKSKGTIEKINIASKDFSQVLSISEKLYGRKEEIEKLVEAFERSRNTTPELILVGGYSGIGKTMLINEIDKPIAARNGYFTTGKFDQYNRDTPYSAISQAFGSLIKQLLSENEYNIAKWKKEILKALGDDGQVLIDVIPELELLIGKQEPVLKIGLNETNLRFGNLFQKFLQALSGSGQPLVIFIDDLQWADSGSLDLLHKTLTNHHLKNILLIGAFRDNEVSPSHPFMMLLEKINKEVPGKTNLITLQELLREQVNQLVADSLRLPPQNTIDLTGLIMNKTQGNPFFIKQFIKKLESEKLVYFDSEEVKWNWDSDAISGMNVTENVVDLVVAKIQKLSPEAKHILQLASCIGNSFDIKMLSVISERPESKLADILWEIVEEGFINPKNKWSKHAKDDLWKELGVKEITTGYDFFQFQHDRIQQAAYSLIPEANKKITHLNIGRLLLQNLKESNQQDNLFDTLSHLNFSIDLITDAGEKNIVAKLNLQAGEKAKRSNAYQPALIFLKAGMDLLENDQTSELFKKLLSARSETEYLCGNHEESGRLFDKAIENAQTKIEKATVLAGKMTLYENTNRQLEAIKVAIRGLKYVGINLPEKPGTVNILAELMKAKYYLRNKSIDKLKENRNMDSPELLVAMKILVNLWGPAYLYNQNLLALAILRMVILSTRYGNCPESALAYSFYGFVCCAQLKDYKTGLEFAKLGMWLNEKFEDKTLRSKVYVIYSGCAAHWSVKYSDLLDTMLTAHDVGVESNDLIYASYAFSFHGKTKFFKGDNLVECRNTLDKYIHFARRIQYPLTVHYSIALGRVLYDITNKSPDESLFLDSADVDVHLKQMQEIEDKDGTTLMLAAHHIYQGMITYHLCKYDIAIEHFREGKKRLDGVLGLSDQIMFNFYSSVSIIAKAIETGDMSFREKGLIRTNIKYFRKISKICPENFETQYLLLNAEWEFFNKNNLKAGQYYAKARISAKEMGLIQFLALANERSARFYEKLGFEDLRDMFLREAFKNNIKWGATAKTIQLREEFPDFNFQDIEAITQISEGMETFADTSSSSFDLQSIFRASTTISGEIVFERLVEKLLKIIVENAGAQKVFLIMNDNGKLKAEAFANYEQQEVMLLDSRNLDEVEDLAHPIVQLVFHTGETLILNDAATDMRFAKDIYIQQQKPKSVLCLPIKQQGQTLAILYLENNIATGAFTPARLELLNLLSGQMAISLENSLLYENLEQKVLERTETIEKQKLEIEAEKEKSDTLLLNILPYETAEELKRTGSYKPRRYDNVSIMFTDFEGFTKLSEKVSTEDLVDMIDHCYKGFDIITSRNNVEKIKTIGDAYMCVSGLPVATPEHAVNAVNAAIEMLSFTEDFNNERKAKNLPYCNLRIGIHSGPVAAGVVGSRKFAYDIWGDSVNIAARLESAGEGGKINISSSTYEIIKDKFKCIHRGKIEAKNKGEIDMYFVV